ncbi:MAG TPA: N-acetylmuramoyl-L-alanine amidase [Gemmatimonadaceae bacterium]|jgi:N-acetylmuramoyl-L-alanine amidase
MIGVVFAAFQLAASAGGARTLVVRDANHSMRVPLVATANGPMLRPSALDQMLPIDVKRDSTGAYTVTVWGARLQLNAGVAVVRVDGESRPLATPPVVSGGELMVPLQLISEVFPSVVPNTRWDADSGQLVLFTSAAAPGASKTSASRADDAPRSARRTASTARAADNRLPPVPEKHFRRTVIVDAGHGGVDNGMTGPIGGGPRIYEKNITLAVAKKLGAELERRGVDVVYTRTTDTLIALDDRGLIANRAKGDLFISIHVNAANPSWKDPGGSRGFETYFLSEAHTEDARRVEQMENSSVQYEDQSSAASSGDPLSFIKADMTQNEHLRESSDLADLIQKSLGKTHPGPSRGVKQAGFRVLVTAYMPSVLVEIGFGTNPKEAAYISNSRDQQAIANAVADGAMTYLSRYEDRVNPNGSANSGSTAGGGGGAPR